MPSSVVTVRYSSAGSIAERLVPVRVAIGAAAAVLEQQPLGGHAGRDPGGGRADQRADEAGLAAARRLLRRLRWASAGAGEVTPAPPTYRRATRPLPIRVTIS